MVLYSSVTEKGGGGSGLTWNLDAGLGLAAGPAFVLVPAVLNPAEGNRLYENFLVLMVILLNKGVFIVICCIVFIQFFTYLNEYSSDNPIVLLRDHDEHEDAQH